MIEWMRLYDPVIFSLVNTDITSDFLLNTTIVSSILNFLKRRKQIQGPLPPYKTIFIFYEPPGTENAQLTKVEKNTLSIPLLIIVINLLFPFQHGDPGPF